MADPVVHITNGVPDSGTGNITTLGAVVTALGTPIQATGGTVAIVAGSAVTGHVVVDTAPTTAVTIATAPVLVAGAAIVGKFGIDPTPAGTPNGVQVNAALPTGANVIGHVVVDSAPTNQLGIVRNVGNAGAVLDFAGQNAAAPANSYLVGAEFNTTPTTLTNGNASPLQLDSAGNLLIKVNAGANPDGRAVPGSSAPVVLSSMTYKAVAASASATLFGATGATGDYLDGVLIIPATATAGAVSI